MIANLHKGLHRHR